MGKATGLRGNFESANQAIERAQDGGNNRDRIGGRVYADNRVAAAKKQSVERRQQNAANVVGRMILLQANAKHPPLAEGVAAMGDVADFRSSEHQIFVAHEFCDRGSHLRSDAPLQSLEIGFGGSRVEQKFTEGADREAADRLKGGGVMRVKNQARNLVGFRWNNRIVEQVDEQEVGQGALCGHALALGSSGDTSELVAGFFLIGL